MIHVLEGLNNEIINLIRFTGRRENEIAAAKANKDEIWLKISNTVAEHNRLLAIGDKHTRQKAIQDPVHGAILLEPWELDLISGWEMLRLRFIKQLGPAHIVYPGATHTRFEHCLGTNYLAQKSIRVINYSTDLSSGNFAPLSQLLDDYHQKIFRASALLHDVGHPPTSHTIEFALHNWSGLSHTDLGEFLIMHSGLTDLLEDNDIEPKDIVQVLKRRTDDPILKLLSDFVDSPLDIDKTDYLIRDAHFSGVDLGVFPAERVLMTNRVVCDNDGNYHRAFMMKALHSLEALILSRSWMFADLYYHHAVRVAEALISKATYFRIEEEDLSKNECVGLFTRMVDADLYRWLSESSIDFVKEYAARIRYRRLFKVVTSRPLASFEEDVWNRFLKMEKDIKMLVEAELELIDSPGQVIIDIVNPELGETFLNQISMLVGGDSGFDLVKLGETQEGKPLKKLMNQQKRTIPSCRVYSDPSIESEIRKRFDKLFPYKEKPDYREDEYDFSEY
ncbi:MAG: HD domain-containing protein [Candidatus Thorarchaeota archaeon]